MFAWLAWKTPVRRSSAARSTVFNGAFVGRVFAQGFNSRGLIVFSLAVLLLTGCLVKSGAREDDTTMDMRHIARVFESIQGFYNRPPKDLEEIKKYLTDFHTDGLNEEPEKVLISSRDGQPYVIIIGSQFGTGTGSEIVIYEKQGAEGKRYVMFADRSVRQLSDDEFRQATFAKGHRPESS